MTKEEKAIVRAFAEWLESGIGYHEQGYYLGQIPDLANDYIEGFDNE